MKRDYWLQRWQDDSIGWHQGQFNSHLQEYWHHLALPPGATVFVPLCGKSLDMLWLHDHGYRVVGVELSPIAVEDFFNDAGLTPQITLAEDFDHWEADGISILLGDFFTLTSKHLEGVSGVFDRASLVALPPDMRTRYAEKLSEIVPRAAQMLLVTLEYDQDKLAGPPFCVPESEVAHLYRARFREELLYCIDVLHEHPRYPLAGIDALEEKVYRLRDVD